MTRRQWFYLVAVLLVLAIGALLAGPGEGTGTSPLSSSKPGGFLALARFLRQADFDVRQADAPTTPSGTFVLLSDLRDDAQAGSLIDWASRGGHLIVADPQSSVLFELGVSQADPIGGVFGTTDLEPRCISSEAIGVRKVTVRVSDSGLTGGGIVSTSCYPGGGGAFVVQVATGSGSIILLGGSSPFTNELLDRADNAAFALGVFAGGGTVAFGPPLPPGATEGRRSMWALLPTSAKAALLALAAALVAFALVRGRRLGMPRAEPLPSPISASELVVATGNLYRAARATAHSGRLLREGVSNRLKLRMGLPPATSPEELAATIDDGTGTRLLSEALTGPDPRNDDELIALGRKLEMLSERVEGTRH